MSEKSKSYHGSEEDPDWGAVEDKPSSGSETELPASNGPLRHHKHHSYPRKKCPAPVKPSTTLADMKHAFETIHARNDMTDLGQLLTAGPGYYETALVLYRLQSDYTQEGKRIGPSFEASRQHVVSHGNKHGRSEDSGSGSDYETSAAKKRRGNLPKAATSKLKEWLMAHMDNPYPSEEEKYDMSILTKLNVTQISNWFINARRRILQPMIDQAKQMHPSGSNEGVIVGLEHINGVPNITVAVRSITDGSIKLSQIQRVGQVQKINGTPVFKSSALPSSPTVIKELHNLQQENISLKLKMQQYEMQAELQKNAIEAPSASAKTSAPAPAPATAIVTVTAPGPDVNSRSAFTTRDPTLDLSTNAKKIMSTVRLPAMRPLDGDAEPSNQKQ